jgi:hypothetical protein
MELNPSAMSMVSYLWAPVLNVMMVQTRMEIDIEANMGGTLYSLAILTLKVLMDDINFVSKEIR